MAAPLICAYIPQSGHLPRAGLGYPQHGRRPDLIQGAGFFVPAHHRGMSRFRKLASIDELIIHCAATPNGRHVGAFDIDAWHHERNFKRHPDALTGKGSWAGLGPHAAAFGSIGYHYVILTSGAVQVGRRLTETGAHCRGHNARSIGVCLVGTDQFTMAQWESLGRLVRAEQRDREKRHLPPLSLHGHSEFNKHKTCPGFSVRQWVHDGYTPPANAVLEGG